MLTDQHPITPPPELVQQWWKEADKQLSPYYDYIATQAARWGADQELHALLTWLRVHHYDNLASDLLAARRPKPPSLAEQALDSLDGLRSEAWCEGINFDLDPIRRALERLQELEECSG